MFSIKITKIYPLYPNRAYIEFEAENRQTLTTPMPTLYFIIQRSENPGVDGPWTDLNSPGTTDYFYIDTTTRLLSMYASVFYRVKMTFNGTTYYSEITSSTRDFRRDEFLRKRKMLYDEEIVLRKFSGRKYAIIKKRHIGERCTKCFDPNTGNVINTKCRTCLGTGFINPYYSPFITYGARLPDYKEVEEMNPDSAKEKDYTKLQILDIPSVSPQDLVVDLQVNDRYKVDRVEVTEMRRVPVHQELVITKLARTDIEYKYKIPANLTELPTDLEP